MLLTWMLAASPALAASWTVDPSGGGDFTTIQGAIDGASSGDTINVVAGTYAEYLDFSGKDLAVVGAGAATTTLDAYSTGAPAAVFIQSGETSAASLSGFTIQNAGARGIHVVGSDPILSDLVITGTGSSSTSAYRGGIYIEDGAVELRDSELHTNDSISVEIVNSAVTLDGVWLHDLSSSSVVATDASVELLDCTFSDYAINHNGMAVRATSSVLTFTDTDFTNNSSNNNSASLVRITGAGSELWFSGGEVRSNTFGTRFADADGLFRMEDETPRPSWARRSATTAAPRSLTRTAT